MALLLSASVAAADAPRLRDIRCMGGREYRRLVLDLSDTVSYRLQRLPATAGGPARVYVDLLGARLTTAPPACAAAGPLARMQVAQTDQGLRLVLDVPGLTAARAFPLADPFRLVVDVEAAPPSPTAAPATPTPVGSTQARRRVRVPPAPPSEPPPGTAPRVKIVLDPGHGGKDPGASGVGGLLEKDAVLAIALALREQLRTLPDVEVVLTRERDVFLSLEERTARANAERADLFVSIHANASPNTASSGIETYYLNNTNDRATLRLAAMENGLASVTGRRRRDRDVALLLSSLIQNYKVAESTALAESVQRDLIGAVGAGWPGVIDLGVKQGPFYVLVGAGMPCVLVEVSFVTHHEEGARLAQAAYREAIATGLLRGIRRFVQAHRTAGTL